MIVAESMCNTSHVSQAENNAVIQRTQTESIEVSHITSCQDVNVIPRSVSNRQDTSTTSKAATVPWSDEATSDSAYSDVKTDRKSRFEG